MRKLVIFCILFSFIAGSVFAVEDNLAVKLTVTDQTAVSFTKNKFDFTQGSSAEPGHDGFVKEPVNEVNMPVITLSADNNSVDVYASAKTNSADGLTLYLDYDDLKTKGGTYSIPLTVTYDSSSVDYANQSMSDINDQTGYGSDSDKRITLTDPVKSSNGYGLRAISHKITISVNSTDIDNATGTGDNDPYQATLKLTTEPIG